MIQVYRLYFKEHTATAKPLFPGRKGSNFYRMIQQPIGAKYRIAPVYSYNDTIKLDDKQLRIQRRRQIQIGRGGD